MRMQCRMLLSDFLGSRIAATVVSHGLIDCVDVDDEFPDVSGERIFRHHHNRLRADKDESPPYTNCRDT
jgi:hypothetical protein